MALPGWVDWTNTGIGASGLFLTAGALWQATGAKKAASATREAIWRREAGSSLNEIEQIATEFALLIELERPREASVRGKDLATRIPLDRERFERFLNADSDKLRYLEKVYDQIAMQIVSTALMEDKIKIQETIERVREANRELIGIRGRLLARLDEEEP